MDIAAVGYVTTNSVDEESVPRRGRRTSQSTQPGVRR